MNEIQNYQKKCWQHYKKEIGFTEDYKYLYGNPVKVHVPVDVATNGIMIVGAYPTAHFNTIDGIRDVPVGDHLYPFSNESYFDGSSVRSVKSGQELEDYYLTKLGISGENCWITDLVKVFLFKEGHTKKYADLGKSNYHETRSMFKTLAEASISFLHQEIELAQPEIVLSLGAEVASIILGVSENKAKELMTEHPIELISGDKKYLLFALPHPGIIMRNSSVAKKWRKVLENQLTEIKKHIS